MMRRRWPWWGLVLTVVLGVGAGFAMNPRQAQAVPREELFQAVKAFLTEARVPVEDMPKAVRKVSTLPNGHYLVEMQMNVGIGWFEVWQEGGEWQVKGAPPPG